MSGLARRTPHQRAVLRSLVAITAGLTLTALAATAAVIAEHDGQPEPTSLETDR